MSDIMKVLYNNCYGDGFVFSEAFLAEYKKRTGQSLDTYKALFHLGPQSIRCNATAIAIFEEKGSEWCSGPSSELAIVEVPAPYKAYWEIEEDGGDERVRLLKSEALADVLHAFMRSNDRAALERSYALLNIKAEADDTVKHGGYGYFDNGDAKADSGRSRSAPL